MKIGTITAQRILRECAIFADLTDAELEKIAELATEKEYEPGDVILTEGQNADELLVIIEGKVALQTSLPKTQAQLSRKLTIDILTRNDVVGFSGVVEPYIYTFSAVCLQKVRALSINGTRLRWLLKDNPKVGYEVLKGLIRVVASRLNETRQLLITERSLALKSE